MALFLGLYLGHIVGDFVFQPGKLVVAKRHGPAGVILHTTIVAACTALVNASSLERTWPAVVAAGVVHFGVEHLTIRARRAPSGSNLTVFLLDQGIHIVSLALIAIALTGPAEPVIVVWPVRIELLAAVCGIATVAFLGSILVFETQVAAAATSSAGPDPILGLDAARLYGIIERGAALAIALSTPLPALGMLAFAPRIVHAVISPPTRRARDLVAASVGLGLCVLVWVLVVAATQV